MGCGTVARGTWTGRWPLGLALVLLVALGAAGGAHAQDVVDQLRAQRRAVRTAEVLARLGLRSEPRPPRPVPVGPDYYLILFERTIAARQAYADSLAAAVAAAHADSVARAATALVDPGPVRWRPVAAHEQGDFILRYREVFWRSVDTPAPFDTVATPELRARLAALFGAPTRNAAAAEQEGYAGSEFVQFEYWLVANDSIPVLVLDLDGPFGRGLLVASDEAHARVLPALKTDLARRVLAAGPPAPYADYYQSRDREGWFRTGFDGTAYFTTPVRTPRWARDRREGVRWRIYR